MTTKTNHSINGRPTPPPPPLNSAPFPINSRPSLSNHSLLSTAVNFLPAPPISKRRRSLFISASIQVNTNGKENLTQAAQLQGLADQLNCSVNSKDSRSFPKALSSTDHVSRMESRGSRIRVAYQGVPDAYSESTPAKTYPNCEAVPCEQFDTAFEAVEQWLVDRAVLPIENSLGGSIHRSYDLLLRHRLHIVGEVKLAVRHCLLANHGVKVEDLKRVLSHPQALAQCENKLTRLGMVKEAEDGTAGAAKVCTER